MSVTNRWVELVSSLLQISMPSLEGLSFLESVVSAHEIIHDVVPIGSWIHIRT
jgi:hypothetical protein